MVRTMNEAVETYPVVLLIEQALSASDAAQVRSLHESLDQSVTYHALLPLEDAAARIEASLGSLGSGEVLAGPATAMTESDLDALRRDCATESQQALADTLAALTAAGAIATGEIVQDPPIDALVAAVRQMDAREAIILTRPHVVAEFFGLDWSSKARRKIGVPVLHLIEHENFDEQAGAGEGISGL